MVIGPHHPRAGYLGDIRGEDLQGYTGKDLAELIAESECHCGPPGMAALDCGCGQEIIALCQRWFNME